MTKNEITTGDALEFIGTQTDADLIILDPQYDQWSEFIKKGLIEKSIDALKDTGNILCFTKQPFDYDLRIAVNKYFRREIVWTFENGGAWVSNKMPLVSFQKIYWLTKTERFYFNPRTGVEYSGATKDFKRSSKVFEGYREAGRQFEKSEDGIWLRDHLHFNKPSCGNIPQKPRELIEIFIKCFCPPDGLVIDLFAGSGQVSIVAKETRRNSTGAEIDAKRADRIRQKIAEPLQMSIYDFIGG